MNALKNYSNLTIDDLDLALTERHLQNEAMLWVYDTGNADFQNIANFKGAFFSTGTTRLQQITGHISFLGVFR